MFPQNATEKKKKCKAVNDSTGSDVPSWLSEQKRKGTAANPNGEEYIGSNLPVEVEQAPRQEE